MEYTEVPGDVGYEEEIMAHGMSLRGREATEAICMRGMQ